MTIKHIVLPGGGPNLLYLYGAIKYLSQNNFWKLENIISFYGTSAGALISTIISLGIDWKELDNYLINRPWSKITNMNPETFFNAFSEKGIIDKTFFIKLFKPLLGVKDININITLQDFFNFNKINLNLYSTELNEFKPVCFSHKSHPKMLLIDAIYCSCALPPIFKPYINGTNCFFDGGVFNNYPLYSVLKNKNINSNEILSINFKYNKIESISDKSHIGEYFYFFIQKMLEYSNDFNKNNIVSIKNELIINIPQTTIDFWFNIFFDSKSRSDAIINGEESAKLFLSKLNNTI